MTNTTTAIRTSKTSRTGKVSSTITVTYPDGTTSVIGGKRAERASAVVVVESHEQDYSKGTPGNRPWAGWEWGYCGVRADVAAAQREASKYAGMPQFFRNCSAVLVTEG